MNLPRLAVHRPITTVMLLVSILVLGGIALARIPLAYLPELDIPFIMVQVSYPNSNPTQIEKEITKPIEESLSTLSGIKTLNSTSNADGAEFFIEFDWGHELDIVRMQVSEKVEQIKPELPAEIGEIVIFSFNTTDIPVVQARISARGVDLSENYDLLESRVANRIRRVPGVARVELEGVEPKEISIDLILDKVKEHRVDIGQLIGQLRGASSNMVLGQVADDGLRFTTRALGGFKSLDEIGSMIINEQGLKLGDIAEIVYEEPPIAHGRHLDGDYAIALEVSKESTANTVEVVQAVMSVIHNDINNDPLLNGVQVFVWDDQAEAITNSLYGLTKAGAIGALLAIFCLYFFLRRLDSTVIVALSIPFSLIATVGVLYFSGKSLNILSMMGLMLAVGMLVDNGVVVLESIDRNHRQEPDPKNAALKGARQVAVAVGASTVTTLIVFLPLIVGASTELTTWLKEVGIPISIALVCSLFGSLTLIPLMSAHFLKPKKSEPSRIIARLEDRYVSMLRWTLHHRAWTFVLLIAFLGIGLLPFFTGMVESAIFGANVNKRLFMSYEFSDFVYKSEAEDVVDQVEAVIDEHKEELEIASVYSYYQENLAQSVFVLERQDMSEDEVKELRQKIRDLMPEVPGAKFVFYDDSDSGGSATYFAVKLFGQDTGVLERFSTETARRLETVDGIQDVRDSLTGNRREVRVKLDRDKAIKAGLDARDIADVFAFTLGGMRLQRFNAGDREVETWLALRLEDRENLDDLKSLTVGNGRGDAGRAGSLDDLEMLRGRGQGGLAGERQAMRRANRGGGGGQLPPGEEQRTGRPVLLGDIAEFEIVPNATEIQRENRKVRVAVEATYEGEDWETTKAEIEGLMNAFDLPPGYSWSWNDRIIEQEGEDAQMGVNFLLALLLVYLVMASLFESLAQPFAILFSIPFALPGAAWLLAATGTPFNLMAQIGLLILMGVVVNNGIVLLDYVNQLRARGFSSEEAILQAGRERMRPILMTATTTIIGLVPLAVRGSFVGGLFYYPMARTVMGGLMSSAVLTLLVLPYISLGVEAVSAWLRRLWRGSATVPGATPAPEALADLSATTAP